MKYMLTTLIILFSIATTSCQEKEDTNKKASTDAPEVVMMAFQKKYPGENDPDFELDSHGYWEAHFKKKGIKYRADFNADGSWIETENSITMKELPTAIKKKIYQYYALYTVTEIEHVMSAEKGEFYDVEFKQKGKNKDIEFREDGTILE